MTVVTEPASVAPARPANLLHAIRDIGVAGVALVVADVVVRLVPFGIVARRIEGSLRHAPPPDEAGLAVRRVKWAIGAAQRRLPWTVPCLATAIAANRLLARRGVASELWLGVRANERLPIDAHAWLVAAGCMVTGGAEAKSYRPLRSLITKPAPLH